MGAKRDQDGPFWVAIRKTQKDMLRFAMQENDSVVAAARFLRIHVSYFYQLANDLDMTAELKIKKRGRTDKSDKSTIASGTTLPSATNGVGSHNKNQSDKSGKPDKNGKPEKGEKPKKGKTKADEFEFDDERLVARAPDDDDDDLDVDLDDLDDDDDDEDELGDD